MISIIMPVYNAQNYLDKSIGSVIIQSCDKWELIAMDDGSTDNSLEILEGYAEKEPRIRVFHQENQGPGIARNNAVKYATGDYVAFLDADDYIDINYIEILQKEIFQTNADVIFFNSVQEHQNGSVIQELNKSCFSNLTKEELVKNQLSAKLEWGMPNKIVKKSVIVNNGLLCSEDPVGEEALFSFELLRNAKVIKFVNKILYHYVHNSTGQHSKGDYDPWKSVVLRLKKHLQDNSIYVQYQKLLNCLAIKALSICLYRVALTNKKKQKLKLMKEKCKWYKENFSFNSKEIDKCALDKTSKLLLPLIKINAMFPIIILSKIRSFKLKRK